MTGAHALSTSRSATALRTTSGPMPAGSPIVMPTRGRRPTPARSADCGEALLIARSRNRVRPDEGTPAAPLGRGRRAALWGASVARLLAAAVAVFGLEHVLDVVLEKHDVGRALAVDLQGAAVVPLDGALDLLAVHEHDDHLGVRVHLLLVVENLRVRLGLRDLLAAHGRGGRGRRRLARRRHAPARAVLRRARRAPLGAFPRVGRLAALDLWQCRAD